MLLCSLMFLAAAGGAGCVPAVPSVDDLAGHTGGGGTGVDVFADAAAPPSLPPRPDAAPPRPPPDATAGAEVAPAAADAALDAGADSRGNRIDGAASAAASLDGDGADTGDAPAVSDGPVARAPRAGDLVIDELLVDPVGDDLGHEWIEIASLADGPLALASLHVSDGTTDAPVNAGVLAPGRLLVLGQTIDRAHNGDAPVDLAYGTRLALNNGADRIAICLGPCSGGLTLDAVAWTMAWGPGYVGHAVVVDPTGATCPAATPYGADGNYGTPGQPNPACPGATAPPATAPPEMSKLPSPG